MSKCAPRICHRRSIKITMSSRAKDWIRRTESNPKSRDLEFEVNHPSRRLYERVGPDFHEPARGTTVENPQARRMSTVKERPFRAALRPSRFIRDRSFASRMIFAEPPFRACPERSRRGRIPQTPSVIPTEGRIICCADDPAEWRNLQFFTSSPIRPRGLNQNAATQLATSESGPFRAAL